MSGYEVLHLGRLSRHLAILSLVVKLFQKSTIYFVFQLSVPSVYKPNRAPLHLHSWFSVLVLIFLLRKVRLSEICSSERFYLDKNIVLCPCNSAL